MSNEYILAIDQGTTSSRAIVFDQNSNIISLAQQEFTQHYPQDGWVEHDPEEIWQTVLSTCKKAIKEAEKTGNVVAIGITNQRETTIVWDRSTGIPIYNAIVWQDRRTAADCERLKNNGLSRVILEKTGLLLDPYFSATKISWILDNVANARALANQGKLAFGTIDAFLISRLTGNTSFVTDATNASRTSLFNISTQQWDNELLEIFNIPDQILPKVLDCADNFGTTKVFDQPIPILGVAGDQHAAAIGQCCFSRGNIKSTYGTGCFVMVNTGKEKIESQHHLLSTIAYRLDGVATYALEGSIFTAGAGVKWLRDGIHLIENAAETEVLAKKLADNGGVYLVPAFSGLGAPYWRPDIQGMLCGLRYSTSREHIVRATLESVCYQTLDLLKGISAEGTTPNELKVDGGMVANNWLMQFLADIVNLPVRRPVVMETTALGAAYLAGLKYNMYSSLEQLSNQWQLDKQFDPQMELKTRESAVKGWKNALEKLL